MTCINLILHYFFLNLSYQHNIIGGRGGFTPRGRGGFTSRGRGRGGGGGGFSSGRGERLSTSICGMQ